jgi:hypothetical protein
MPKNINPLNRLSIFASHHNDPRASFLPLTFRLSTLGLLLIFHFSLLLFHSCGMDVEDPTPPSPPLWVQKSLPEEWPERGIDAHESGGIYLEWESNPEDNIVAYMIYRAEYFDANDSLGNYELLSVSEVDQGSKLEYVDESVKTKTQYYFKLKAEDSARNRSGFSDSTGFSVLRQIPGSRMNPNGLSDALNIERILIWWYDTSLEMEIYCLTLTTKSNDFITRCVFNPGDYTGGTEFFIIPNSIDLEQSQIYKWRIDASTLYVNGIETAGSESPWATFIYTGD